MDINVKLIETVVAIVIYVGLRWLSYRLIDRTVTVNYMQKTRGKIIKKTINVLLLILAITFVLSVWGVDQRELLFFVGSILTVLGIALFAQWSILSNITSGVILFFYHAVKLDEHIAIIDKDYEVAGRVSDIGLFFVIIKTAEGESVSIPNNVFIQKMIKQNPSRSKTPF